MEDERFTARGLRLLLKRDDLIHPELVGNKWRKLAPNLAALAGRPLLTFGGAYPTTCGPRPPPDACSACPPSGSSGARNSRTGR